MTQRIENPFALAPDIIKAVMGVSGAVAKSGLEHSLIHLIDMRASQINGCAYCLHMHATEARAGGESEMRLYMLSAWRESTLYTPRERAALAWTEALTHVAQTGAPDADFDGLAGEFSEQEIVQLTLAIGVINLWNRMQVGLRGAHPVRAEDLPRAA